MVLQKTKASGTDALIYICNSKGADSQLRYKMPLSSCPNNSENCDEMGDIIDRLAQLSTACEGLIYRTQSISDKFHSIMPPERFSVSKNKVSGPSTGGRFRESAKSAVGSPGWYGYFRGDKSCQILL